MGLCALLVFSLACEEGKQDASKSEEVNPIVPVDLPSVPADLGQSKIPEKYADGSLTIDGLRRNRRAHLGKDILIKGTIAWIYECPYADEYKKRRRKKKKDDTKDENLCQRDHFYISDGPREEERLLVVGVSPFLKGIIEKKELKVGEEHIFNGRYTDIADGFAAADKGLLKLGEIKGFEEPPDK
jgi:hypothetical protein